MAIPQWDGGASGVHTNSDDQIRLMTRVARLYYEKGARQAEIARTLNISQPRVSRLLKRASEVGIVRITVAAPSGVYAELEEQIEQRFGLSQVVVTPSEPNSVYLTKALGSAAAEHITSTIFSDERIGISSWSASLLEVVDAMPLMRGQVAQKVVQLVGGHGQPNVQIQATRLLSQISQLTGAEPVVLPAPGVVQTKAGAAAFYAERGVQDMENHWDDLTLALVGIGSLDPSPLAQQSGNAIGPVDKARLSQAGAVGDICFRFFDEHGKLTTDEIADRVVGISPEKFFRIPRRLAVAGGEQKFAAILGAIRGNWLTELVTDVVTAQRLMELGD